MNIQQFRYIRETVRQNLSLTQAAEALHTSQSGVSRQIREFELELGVEIFLRQGRRFLGLTEIGMDIVHRVDRILAEIEAIKPHVRQFSGKETGRLVVATTHAQARYTLPDVVERFMSEFPAVHLEIRQDLPRDIARDVQQGQADLGIATDALGDHPDLLTLPCFSWQHVVIAPQNHPLHRQERVTLEDLQPYPIVTYTHNISGRHLIDQAIESASLALDIRLTAMDADVIKDYVSRGLGVGILSELAVQSEMGALRVVPALELGFETAIAKIALRKGARLHNFAYRFIELLAPHLTPELVQRVATNHLSARPLSASETARLSDIPKFSTKTISRI